MKDNIITFGSSEKSLLYKSKKDEASEKELFDLLIKGVQINYSIKEILYAKKIIEGNIFYNFFYLYCVAEEN